ncbi:hypothetical protein [Nocardia sp. alder85J]|uniref:hypothetical protein n=1 Tax=Nocardia sp. alder85J TaxID=2862949 RepID=UPI001CD464BD|nr:hypothetical protein [Nocardia sp. alder85J]MCX4092429.1 hypothetical protein [Nocardia sp. alder85J]
MLILLTSATVATVAAVAWAATAAVHWRRIHRHFHRPHDITGIADTFDRTPTAEEHDHEWVPRLSRPDIS